MDNTENKNNQDPREDGTDKSDLSIPQLQWEGNIIVGILKYTGYGIFCLGFFRGFSYIVSGGPIFLTWVYSFITGVLFVGLSEVIRLLEKISQNTSRD